MDNKPLIELNNISAGYDTGKNVIKGINLKVYQNDFIGIIGPNGGGKSTLLKVILEILKPNKGTLAKNFDSKENSAIGYLPQVNQIDHSFPISAIEVVLSGFIGRKKYFGSYTKADKERAKQLLIKSALEDKIHERIGNLSGGQRQRVFLCRALINNPKVLILDEPNTFVDKHFETELYNYLKELNNQMAILLVTHDIGTISSLVKTIACVNEELHYHHTNKISEEILKTYNCPIELITHGKVPHRVLDNH